LAGFLYSRQQVSVSTHDDEPIHRQIADLELVEDVGLMLIVFVGTQEELASYPDGERKDGVKLFAKSAYCLWGCAGT